MEKEKRVNCNVKQALIKNNLPYKPYLMGLFKVTLDSGQDKQLRAYQLS